MQNWTIHIHEHNKRNMSQQKQPRNLSQRSTKIEGQHAATGWCIKVEHICFM